MEINYDAYHTLPSFVGRCVPLNGLISEHIDRYCPHHTWSEHRAAVRDMVRQASREMNLTNESGDGRDEIDSVISTAWQFIHAMDQLIRFDTSAAQVWLAEEE